MTASTIKAMLISAGAKDISPTSEGFACICPIHHGERRTFNINITTGLWQCWNPDCGKTGNLLMFLVQIARMPYPDAVDFIRNVPVEAGIDLASWRLPEYDMRGVAAEGEFLSEAVLGLYDKCPTYMLKRGFTKAYLRKFDIGWDEKVRRVTFPIRDPIGRLIGFTRRTVADEEPKYLLDCEKTRTLYMLHTVPSGADIGVTEGTTDVMRARLLADEIEEGKPYIEAFRNMTATFGGPVTEEQAVHIARRSPNAAYLAFDNDKAGFKATKKSITNLREAGVHKIFVVSFQVHDLDTLDSETLGDVTCKSAFSWLLPTRN